MTLFDDTEIQPAPRLGTEALKERLVSAYTQELLDHPPVRSLTREIEVNETERQKLAQRIALKDVSRLLKILPSAGLQISDAGRVADLKAGLSDWLRLSSENEAMGEESVDYDELKARTRRLLNG